MGITFIQEGAAADCEEDAKEAITEAIATMKQSLLKASIPPSQYTSAPAQGYAIIQNSNGEESTMNYPTVSNSGPECEEEPVPTAELASVSYLMSHTKNLGNYEFLRVEVGITRPCLGTELSISAAHHLNRDWVEEKMEEIIVEAENL